MPDDVITKAKAANNYKNGGVMVSVDVVGVTANHTIDPKINKTQVIISQSGTLDARFDDVRYYSGDSIT
jgi:hypothetical protein